MLFFLNKALPDSFWCQREVGTCSLPSSQPSQSQQQEHLTSQGHKALEYWGGSLIMDLSRGLCSAARKNDLLHLESPEQHFSAHHSKKSPAKAANQRCLLRRNINVYSGFGSYCYSWSTLEKPCILPSPEKVWGPRWRHQCFWRCCQLRRCPLKG